MRTRLLWTVPTSGALMIGMCLLAGCSGETATSSSVAATGSVEQVAQVEAPSWDVIEEDGMVLIPAGNFQMGGDNAQAARDEFPKHGVSVDSFWMDQHEVTNQEFMAFTQATGYITVAERPVNWEELKQMVPPGTPRPPDSVLQPGSLTFQQTETPVPLNNEQLWWRWTIGANWRHPLGPGSDLEGLMDHPVVHMAWEDAAAYADWAGKRLPTEAEWEWAARGGLENMVYPWGNEDVNIGEPKANFWQGQFPYENLETDGFARTAPANSFEPNGYGLYNMAGNAWEWTADFYRPDYYAKAAGNPNLSNPTGPESSFDPNEPYTPKRVTRGGSFLCNDDYCSGYRVARRMRTSPDSGAEHLGFRCVKSVK
ncbi:formylglycine-generating enzyme family protein [Pontibacter sp. G13]|uniref:formylglycine-generating enzyme family protein n=1 Tax=Pontibacter sp. G13 TaxID=3074898 RepID=UPI0028898CFB|nr:formylglycine-generating enzyme family protein [Pontibacter sp. G13]WNJ19251.1 formylglycine-generating enzyme family protein [Pontibacter sp. G13]